jgi:hypothetical protein
MALLFEEPSTYSEMISGEVPASTVMVPRMPTPGAPWTSQL